MSKSKHQSKLSIPNEGQPLFHNPFLALNIAELPQGTPLAQPEESSTPEKSKLSTRKGKVILRRETAHRGGKTVIVLSEFESHITHDQIADIARTLRKVCGSGGTVKEREIEIQGEHALAIRQWLTQQGFRVGGIS